MTSPCSQLPCDLTETQITQLEREAVQELADALPRWYLHLGPGLDTVFLGLAGLIEAVDQVALVRVATDATELQVRAACAEALGANLQVPALPEQRAHRADRIAVLGGARQAEWDMAYEAATLELLAADFGACCEQVGLGGFLNALAEMIQLYAGIFHAQLDSPSIDPARVFRVAATELRRRLEKPTNELRDSLATALPSAEPRYAAA